MRGYNVLCLIWTDVFMQKKVFLANINVLMKLWKLVFRLCGNGLMRLNILKGTERFSSKIWPVVSAFCPVFYISFFNFSEFFVNLGEKQTFEILKLKLKVETSKEAINNSNLFNPTYFMLTFKSNFPEIWRTLGFNFNKRLTNPFSNRAFQQNFDLFVREIFAPQRLEICLFKYLWKVTCSLFLKDDFFYIEKNEGEICNVSRNNSIWKSNWFWKQQSN